MNIEDLKKVLKNRKINDYLLIFGNDNAENLKFAYELANIVSDEEHIFSISKKDEQERISIDEIKKFFELAYTDITKNNSIVSLIIDINDNNISNEAKILLTAFSRKKDDNLNVFLITEDEMELRSPLASRCVILRNNEEYKNSGKLK